MKKTRVKVGEFNEGTTLLGADELADSNSKVRITTLVDGPTLQKFKEFAHVTDGKYQSLINECLNSYAEKFLDEKLKELKRGIHRLEKKKA